MAIAPWYEGLGFTQDPFFSSPIPPNRDLIEKAFVNREKEKTLIEGFVQRKSAKMIVFGGTGEGKSSLLNYAEYCATKWGKSAIRIDGHKLTSAESFVDELLYQLQLRAEKLPDSDRQKLTKRMTDLEIIELRKKEVEETKAGIEGRLNLQGRLSALVTVVTEIAGAIEKKRAQEEEKAYYIAPRMTQLERVVNELLPTIFDVMQTLVVSDDLEKEASLLGKFIDGVSYLIPSNVLFVTTGRKPEEIGSKGMGACYEVFDVPVVMTTLDSEEALEEFIVGRMKACCRKGSTPPEFDDAAIAMLVDRTGGNLRETFRYCSWALQKYKKDISRTMILQSMKEADAARLAALSDPENQTLSVLAGLGPSADGWTLEEVFNAFPQAPEPVTIDTVRDRLDGLVGPRLVSKKLVKSGRTRVARYGIRETAKYILEL